MGRVRRTPVPPAGAERVLDAPRWGEEMTEKGTKIHARHLQARGNRVFDQRLGRSKCDPNHMIFLKSVLTGLVGPLVSTRCDRH